MSSSLRRFAQLRIEQLWIGIPFLIVIWKGFVFPLPLLDFWWHLKMGEIILSTKSIPRVDLFSFTAAGQPFIIQNWLAEVLFFSTYRLGGLPLLVCLDALLLIAALIPVYRLCYELAPSARMSALVACLPAVCLFANLRPQVFSFVLFSIFLWVLFGLRSGRRRNPYWALPFLMLLWVNLHGAFVVGLALIALFLCGEALRRKWSPSSESRLSQRQLRALVLVFLGCVAATALNPEFHRVYEYIHTVVSDPSSQQWVIEWQPPRIDALQGLLLFYCPFFAALLVLIYSDERMDLTEAALFIAFAAFALKSSRNTPWFALVAAPIVARHLFATDWPRRFDIQPSKRPAASKPRPFFNLLVGALGLAAVILFSPWVQPKVYGTTLTESQTPVGAMDYIEQYRLEGNIFHPQVFGDYLIWRLWPRQHSFFDGRVHLFGEDFVKRYRQIFHDSHWEELLTPYQIRYLLLSKDPNDQDGQRMIGEARTSAHWRLLYEDSVSVLFENQESRQIHAQ